MKPTLKKVSKYENKFAKLQKKAAEFNFRNQLKQVKKKEFTLEEEDKEVREIVFDLIRVEIYFFSFFFFNFKLFSPYHPVDGNRIFHLVLLSCNFFLFFFFFLLLVGIQDFAMTRDVRLQSRILY